MSAFNTLDGSCMRRSGKHASHNILPCRRDSFGQTSYAVTKHPSFKLPGFKNNVFSSIKFTPVTFFLNSTSVFQLSDVLFILIDIVCFFRRHISRS